MFTTNFSNAQIGTMLAKAARPLTFVSASQASANLAGVESVRLDVFTAVRCAYAFERGEFDNTSGAVFDMAHRNATVAVAPRSAWSVL